MNVKPTYKELEEENKLLKKKLAAVETNDKFYSFFKNNKAVMLQIDTNTNTKKIINANNAAINFYGYKKDEFLKKTMADLNTLSAGEIDRLMKETISKKSNLLQFKHKLANGIIKDVEIYASPLTVNNKLHMFVTVFDISARKKAEKNLKERIDEFIALSAEYKSQNRILKEAKEKAEENEKRFSVLFNNASIGILVADIKTKKFQFANPEICKLLGYTENELLRMSVNDIHPKDSLDIVLTEFEAQARKEKKLATNLPCLKKDGSVIYTNINTTSFRIDNIEYNIGFFTDITEQRKINLKIKKQNEEYASLNEEYKAQNEKLLKAIETSEKNEQRYKLLSNASFEAIFISENGYCLEQNQTASKMFGYTDEEAVGLFATEIFDEESKDIVIKNILKDYTEPYEVIAVKKDGTKFHAEIQGITYHHKNKKLRFSAIRDITSRKKAEKEKLESERKFKTIIDNLIDIYYRADEFGNLTMLNPSGLKIFGYEKLEQVLGRSLNILYKKKERRDEFVSLLKKHGKVTNYRTMLTKEDGSEVYVETTASILLDKKGKYIGVEGIVRDISSRKEAEKEINKLSMAVEQSANSIVITDTNGLIEYTNPKFSELTGYSKNEALGKNINFLRADTQKKSYYKEMWKTITEGKAWRGEFHNKTKKGGLFWERVNITPLKNENGEIINFIAIKEDITAERNAKKELIKAKEKAEESDRLKSEFINNMSHEIRTPMNGIIGFSQLLSEPDTSTEKSKDYIQIIQNCGNQLLHIIDDILEISKLGTKQVKVIEQEVCLNDVLLNLFSIFDIKAKENLTPLYLKKELSDAESTILTDSYKLNKILSNLLENALKFTNSGFIEFGYKLRNNTIDIFVKDTGVGIKADRQCAIFERFSQEEKNISEHPGGLGLGLSIAKENAELIGGTISLSSEKGKGSTFVLSIPYNPVKPKNKQAKQKQEKTYTILIAEDEEINFLYLETLFETFELPTKVYHSKNGKEAIDFCTKNKTVDLVLMDLKMPVLNGYDACKQIKKQFPEIPVVAQTAYSTKEEREKAFSSGCDDFISKPIDKDTLASIINKYIK